MTTGNQSPPFQPSQRLPRLHATGFPSCWAGQSLRQPTFPTTALSAALSPCFPCLPCPVWSGLWVNLGGRTSRDSRHPDTHHCTVTTHTSHIRPQRTHTLPHPSICIAILPFPSPLARSSIRFILSSICSPVQQTLISSVANPPQ